MNQRNNTKALQREISKLLSKSEMWVVLRLDKEGTHVHMPNEDHMALFGHFFASAPDIFELVQEFVEKYKVDRQRP